MGLTREQWERVEGLFAQAVALPVGERGLFLSKLGGEAPVVVAELSALVDAAEGTGPVDRPVRVVGLEVDDALPAGTLLGARRIGERIGTGGMGEVYAAERADGSYEAEAAAKVLKRGLDTSALVSRFLRERRVLALETAPAGALVDAGEAAEGEALAAGAVARVQGRADRAAWKDYEAPALFERARARRRLGRAADALADAQEAARLLAAISWESSPQLAAARVEAAEALIDLRRPEEAGRELALAAAAHAAHTELADHFRRPLGEARARLRRARG